jgi:hypothetical protein
MSRTCVRLLQSYEAVYGLTVQEVLKTLLVFRVFQIFLLIFCSVFITSSGLRLVRSPEFTFSFGPADGKSLDYMTDVIWLRNSTLQAYGQFVKHIRVKLLGPLMSEIHLNIILNGTLNPTKSALYLFSAYKR